MGGVWCSTTHLTGLCMGPEGPIRDCLPRGMPLGATYASLWKLIIRPSRMKYSTADLGPQEFRIGKHCYDRIDLLLSGSRGCQLACSHFVPTPTPEAGCPCVVYVHGNCSSRLEALPLVPLLLPRGLSLFCLDLSGSGHSDGEYVSLGHHEGEDLRSVVRHLARLKEVTSIGLWGWSMGASAAILCAAHDTGNVQACVLDSAFSELRDVADQFVTLQLSPNMPTFVRQIGYEVLRREVKSRADFDWLEVSPLKLAPKVLCPAFFMMGEEDTLVPPHHTTELRRAWGGHPTMIRRCKGNHLTQRPRQVMSEAADFIHEHLTKFVVKEKVSITDCTKPRRCVWV